MHGNGWRRPLVPLLRTLDGIDRLLPLHDGSPEIDYDVDVEVTELPFVFRTTLESIPARIPYLSVSPAPIDGAIPRVGIAWRCSDWEPTRSIPFAQLRPLLDVDGVRWMSVQHGRRPDEFHPALVDVSRGSLLEAARQIAALDLLVTIDSMPAHLAGALGKPVWTLLLQRADWRWMEDRADSPWYPTMRLFRQRCEGNWTELLARVSEELRGAPVRSE